MFGNRFNTVPAMTLIRSYSKRMGADNRATQIISVDFKITFQYTQPHFVQYDIKGRDSFKRE